MGFLRRTCGVSSASGAIGRVGTDWNTTRVTLAEPTGLIVLDTPRHPSPQPRGQAAAAVCANPPGARWCAFGCLSRSIQSEVEVDCRVYNYTPSSRVEVSVVLVVATTQGGGWVCVGGG